MDTVVARIIEIEKKSALEIEQAETSYRKNIEAHRRHLEEEKQKTHDHIISAEKARLAQSLEALNKKSRESSSASGRDYEGHFHDPELIEAVKEKIVALLLNQ